MDKIEIPKKFSSITDKISKIAKENAFEAYIVGGFVRDIFLNREPKDLDIMIEDKKNKDNARAGIEFSVLLAEKYHLSSPVVFERFGTSKLFIDGEEVEFIMPRKEYYLDNSRNPDTEIGSLQQDALRRDFTVNALFLRLNDMQLLDLTARGFDDLNKKIIRVTDPQNADIIFSQDPLRILRAIRQKLQLGFEIEPLTFNAMKKSFARINIVAPERIRDEINKILVEKNPSSSFYTMKETGVLGEIFPEIDCLCGLLQPKKYHNDDVFAHTFNLLDRTNADLILRIAALLHDVGKKETYKKDEKDKITFYGHDDVGAKIAEKILDRLKYPKEFKRKVVNIVKNHMYPKQYTTQWTDSAVRRFVKTCGDELDYIMALSEADYGKDEPDVRTLELKKRIELLSKNGLLYPKDELISGKELMEYFGLTAGTWIKKAKETVSEARIENPLLTKEEGFLLVKEMLNKNRG